MKVFVSYAREDRERVRPIVDGLRTQGCEVWWDVDLLPGEDFSEMIDVQVDGCDCLIVVWSRDSVASGYVLAEARRARGLHKLLPVFLDDVANRLQASIGAIQGLEVFSSQGGVDGAFLVELYESAQTVTRQANPDVDLTEIDAVLGASSHWAQVADEALTPAIDISLVLQHGRAILDWALSHGPNAYHFRAVGISFAEFQKCLERRHVDYKARFFDDLGAYARACCHESPFQVFRKGDGELTIGHRFKVGREEIFQSPERGLSIHSAEYYRMILRKESPKILHTRMRDIEAVVGKLLGLGLAERPAMDVLDSLAADHEIDLRRGELMNIIYTLRNCGLVSFTPRGQGPMNGELALRSGVVQLVARQEINAAARRTIERVLGAANLREIDRLLGSMPSFELRPVA